MSEEHTSTSVAESLAKRQSHFGVVKLGDLKIDTRFQRTLNLNAVRKIRQEFHPAGVGCILVAQINGDTGYSVVDGQTRYRAMDEQPAETLIQAEIFDGIDVAEAAMLFRLRNNQKPIPPKERDRVATNEGDPVMTEVVRQAAAAEYTVFVEDPDVPTLPAKSLSEAKMIVRWGLVKSFPDLLARALLIQARAFESPEGSLLGTIQPKVLAATAELILHNENLNDDELARVMNQIGFGGLEIQVSHKAEQEGTRIKSAAKSVLVDRYNKGKRGDDRITR